MDTEDKNQDPQDNIYNCDDENLGAMLHRLFSEGHDEVQINHPVDGPVVITREQFYGHVKEIDKALKMSPAEKLKQRKRLENLAKQKQIRFRTAMITAEKARIDVAGDDNFGYDTDGNQLDIDGMVFVPTTDYLDGIDLLPDELGCMVDEHGDRPPLRLVAA